MTFDREMLGLIVGAGLTFLIFTYLLGDNFLYRLALHLFIGLLLGYTLGIVLLFGIEVLGRLASGEHLMVIPVILGILLLMKGFRRYAYIGNFSVAFLVGVGTAVALSGALLGTLVPQIRATGHALSGSDGQVQGLVIVGGTLCTLLAFDFTLTAKKQAGLVGAATKIVRFVGRVFLIIVFGVAFAGALTASLSIFIGRIQYLINAVETIGIALGLL